MRVPSGSDGSIAASFAFTASVDGARVLAHQHQRDADDDLALAVLRRRAAPEPRAELHVADRRDRDGHALRRRADDDAAEVVEVLDEAVGADDEVLAVVLDVAAAGVGVRLLERVDDLRDRDAGGLEPLRVEHDLVLLVSRRRSCSPRRRRAPCAAAARSASRAAPRAASA